MEHRVVVLSYLVARPEGRPRTFPSQRNSPEWSYIRVEVDIFEGSTRSIYSCNRRERKGTHI